jgi:hypothetical protein
MYAGPGQLDDTGYYAARHNWIVSNHNWWERVVLNQQIPKVSVVWNLYSPVDYCLAYIYNAAAHNQVDTDW